MIWPTRRFPRCFALLLASAVTGVLAARAPAQCATQWLPGQGLPGTNYDVVAATEWDPDGPGPSLPVVVAAGGFNYAGAVVANFIATHDPVSGAWSALGAGMNTSFVYALAALPNGELVAGGQFTMAGGVAVNQIARWNGVNWSALGSGMSSTSPTQPPYVRALATLPNGDLVAGGFFTSAGGVSANSIARWDGTGWSALGAGVNGGVSALTTLPNGDLVAAGSFITAGGVSANNIARWDGTSWSALGAGTGGLVTSLATLPNGDVVAGGMFLTAGGVNARGIARWNGTNWSALGTGVNATVFAVAALPNGDVVAGGGFTIAGGVAVNRIARWNGANWSTLGQGIENFGGLPNVFALTVLANGDLVAGGFFELAGLVGALNVARWNGASWFALGGVIDEDVNALIALPGGGLVAGGSFTTAGGVAARSIARWDGTSWWPLGSGMNSVVNAVAALPNGELVAGGEFTMAGGVAVNRIARWDGANWSALGSGMSSTNPSSLPVVFALTTLPNGDVVAGGRFDMAGGVSANNIARWNGTSWSPLGSGAGSSSAGIVYALATLPNGDLVAGGYFFSAGGVSASRIARWNGTSWSALGTGTNDTVRALTTLANGDLVAGGYFSSAGSVSASHIARWNGASWSALGSGTNDFVWTLATLPNGDVVAGGGNGTTDGFIARWNGAVWSPLATSVGGGTWGTWVLALATLSNGDVAMGGSFTWINGGAPAPNLAWLTTTCPATAVAAGTGCTGSGGPNVLAATTLPWLGSTFRAVATGMPGNAIAVRVLGLGTWSVPLLSIFPQAGSGCSLFVTLDLLDFYLPTAGSLTTQFAIPNTITLAGQVFHQQVAPLEFDVLGNLTALTSTNALTLTIGSF